MGIVPVGTYRLLYILAACVGGTRMQSSAAFHFTVVINRKV